MIEIINCRSGKKSFKDSRNPYIDRSEFAKIERLRPDSVFFSCGEMRILMDSISSTRKKAVMS